MSWGIVATVGGAVVGGLIASDSSRKAANTQADAAREANDSQKYMYDQTRADYAPYREAGYNALNSINNLLKNPASITNDPGYQFAFDQGTRAINSQAAAHGGYYSGATLKSLARFGQGMAGQQLGNVFNRYASVAGLGQTATGGTSAAGLNYANQVGNNMMGAANARGAASIAQGNAWQNAINSAGYYGMNYWNQRPQDAYNPYASPDTSGTNGGFGYKNGVGGF